MNRKKLSKEKPAPGKDAPNHPPEPLQDIKAEALHELLIEMRDAPSAHASHVAFRLGDWAKLVESVDTVTHIGEKQRPGPSKGGRQRAENLRKQNRTRDEQICKDFEALKLKNPSLSYKAYTPG